MKKLSKKDKNYIFSIVILAILLVLSVIYNVVGGFGIEYSVNCASEVGDDYTLKLDGIGAKGKSFALKGSSLPNDKIKQKFVIVLPELGAQNTVLRAKASLLDTDVMLLGFDTWQKDENDGYYYFLGEMYSNQSIGLCSEILWGDVELKNSMVYAVEFVVELYYQSNIE